MNLNVQNLDEAIALLRTIVKYSAVEGQKHIDFTIGAADNKIHYQKALMLAQNEVEKGTLTADELKQRIGLLK